MTSKSSVTDLSSKQGTNETMSNPSDRKEDRNKSNGGKEAAVEEVVDLEKYLLACRSSLVYRKQSSCSTKPAENQPSANQSCSLTSQNDQSPCSSINAPAENQPSTSQLSFPTPHGLRAHITLGCTEGVRPMQTGLDQV